MNAKLGIYAKYISIRKAVKHSRLHMSHRKTISYGECYGLEIRICVLFYFS